MTIPIGQVIDARKDINDHLSNVIAGNNVGIARATLSNTVTSHRSHQTSRVIVHDSTGLLAIISLIVSMIGTISCAARFIIGAKTDHSTIAKESNDHIINSIAPFILSI